MGSARAPRDHMLPQTGTPPAARHYHRRGDLLQLAFAASLLARD